MYNDFFISQNLRKIDTSKIVKESINFSQLRYKLILLHLLINRS